MFSKKELKDLWKKFWFLLWKDDSFKGWIFSIVVIFIFIKFIFFPSLSLVAGTTLPLAIVESCSMYHNGNLLSNYDKWWADHEEKYSKFDIGKSEFKKFVFDDGLNKGDILFVTGTNPKKLKVGDVIIFNAGITNPVIHRIVKISNQKGKLIFSTMGDNNNGQLSFEKSIQANRIVGEAQFKIAPYLGWMKLIFFENQKPYFERGLCKQD